MSSRCGTSQSAALRLHHRRGFLLSVEPVAKVRAQINPHLT
jgi:hypothetical protein